MIRDDKPEQFLLDTNVISEVRKESPDKVVMAWMDVWEVSQIYMSVVSICEISKGISKMPLGRKRDGLHYWFEHDLLNLFRNRILKVDYAVAIRWGQLLAKYEHYGALDMLFAATALEHQLTMVTRNEKHFRVEGLRVMNPWLS